MQLPLQRQLKDQLIRNTGEVLQQLRQIFANNPESYNEVILISQRFERLKIAIRKGTYAPAEQNLEQNIINDAVLELIDGISDAEAAAFDLANAVFKRMLVVCKSAGREHYMRKLFPETYFKGVEYDISGNQRPASSVDQFDLVIFDNYPPDGPEGGNELLQYYLEQTNPYLLYFGSAQLELLRKFPDKAYFANSVFSLHSRLEEMIRFLKYYETADSK